MARTKKDTDTRIPVAWCEGEYGGQNWYYIVQPPYSDMSCVATMLMPQPPTFARIAGDLDAAMDAVEEITGEQQSWMNEIPSMEDAIARAAGNGHVDPEQTPERPPDGRAQVGLVVSGSPPVDDGGFVEPGIGMIKQVTDAEVRKDIAQRIMDSAYTTSIPAGSVFQFTTALTMLQWNAESRRDPKTGKIIPLQQVWLDRFFKIAPAQGNNQLDRLIDLAQIRAEETKAGGPLEED